MNVRTAIVVTWLVTAAWDFLCATLLSVLAYGSTFSRLWQGVAATAIGPAALTMGGRGVAVGLGLHLPSSGPLMRWSSRWSTVH